VSTGELLTRWTVRLALVLYAMTLALRLAQPPRRRAARWLWTAGCGLFLAHVACAFHFFHGWSHADALRETARQTEDLIGYRWGGGLYLNYLFALVWLGDVLAWWLGGLDLYERRPRRIDFFLHSFMGFMAFNGAVVFASGPTRTVGAVVTIVLCALLVTRWFGMDRLTPSRD
jgi:hypothetical protein